MLFGSSGIRRRYDSDLVHLALSLGSAVGRSGGDFVLGQDTRTTGAALASLLSAGITGSGGSVYRAGMVPTPAVAFAAGNFSLGIMITASHNPEEYNGFKIFRPDGSSCSGDDQRAIEETLREPAWESWDRQGAIRTFDAISPYVREIVSGREPADGVRMVLDCGNGAGCLASPLVLDQLGADVCCINANPSGRFARPSEPLERYLPYIPGMIRMTGSRGAIVHDGDADRMMAFDNRARFIGGDQLMMLFAEYLGAKRVVTTYDASMAIEEIAEVRRTPVGDTYVAAELSRWGDFGGESSGAWIFPSHSLCPDGPYAAALYCEIASAWDVAGRIDAMPSYPVIRESVPCDNAGGILTLLGAPNPTDGIRITSETGWCLIRASGTEPKIRITAEGRDRESARALFEKGRALLKERKAA